VSGRAVVFADATKIYYASTLSIYIYCAKRFILEKVITVSEKTLTGMCVSTSNHDIVATVSCDGCGSLWRLSDSNLMARANTQLASRYNMILMELNSNNCVFICCEPHIRVLYWDTSKVMSSVSEIFAVKKANMKSTCAVWNPHANNKLAVGCNNSWIILFNTKEKTPTMLQVPERTSPVVQLQWDRLSSVYLLAAYKTFITLWDTETCAEIQIFEKQHSPISGIAWLDWTAGNFISTNEKTGVGRVWNVSQKQPLEAVKIASCGTADCFVCPASKSVITANSDGSVSVFNLQKNQTEFCIAAGHTDTVFDCAFDPTTPEIFATASYDGTIKIWNISTLSLMKTLRGGDTILYNCSWSRNGKFMAGSASDGHILLWDVDTGREVSRLPLHAKASYAVAWSKSSDGLFCSTSADGTAVVVRVNSECLFGQKSTVSNSSPVSKSGQSLSPSRSGQSQIPTDAETADTSVEIEMKYLHPAAVYGCSWCNHHPNLLATGCQDGHVRVFDYTATTESPLLYDLRGHTRRAFNCVWSMLDKGMLASGSDDATIMVWRVDVESIAIRFSGRESTSPRIRPTLSTLNSSKEISGRPSSPTTIMPALHLCGHKSNVRALTFSSEHKHLLISGSWDATIRLWDLLSGQCIKVVAGHCADVYGIASHMDRPFTFISCSRDTTIRIWELQGVVSLLRMTAVLDMGLDRVIGDNVTGTGTSSSTDHTRSLLGLFGYQPESADEKIDGPREASGPSSASNNLALRPALSGRGSTRLQHGLKKLQRTDFKNGNINAAECFYRLFSFFSGSNGCMDMWEAVLIHLNKLDGEPSAAAGAIISSGIMRAQFQRVVFHEDEVIAKTFEDATKRAAKRRSSERNDELVLQAALMHAKCGNFESYCNMMVSLNEWTAALAVAPRASMAFWRTIASQYADYLQSVSSEDCVPYYLCSSRNIEATAYYLRRRETGKALIAANAQTINSSRARENSSRSIDEENYSFDLDLLDEKEPLDRNVNTHTTGHIVRSNDPTLSASVVRSVFEHSAQANIRIGKPFIAAAEYIAAGNIDEAVNLLLLCGEVDSAYALASCLNRLSDSVIIAFANELGKYGALILGIELLRSVQNCQIHIGLLYSKYMGSSDTPRALSVMDAMPVRIPKEQWLKKAAEEEAIGNDMDAVLTYILGLNYSKAIAVGLSALRKAVKEPLDFSSAHRRIASYLKCIRLSDVDEGIRMSFYSHMLWIAAHEAAEMGLWDAASGMLKVLKLCVGKCIFFLSPSDIIHQVNLPCYPCAPFTL
jgi:WD40 repeat protein